MQTLQDFGTALANRRKRLGLKQQDVACRAGVTVGSLSRLERGHLTEFGVRKLTSILAVLGMELQFIEKGMSGSLDELRKERGGS